MNTVIDNPIALPQDAPNSGGYQEDCRESNPGLHLLYTRWACKHLTIIDRMIQELNDLANLNMLDMVSAMCAQREKLISENAAYAEAHYMLLSADAGRVGKATDEEIA